MNKIEIIGGNHGLPQLKKGKIFKSLSKYTLVNARSCLYAILKYLNMPVIWMPSYLCESLLHSDYNIKFYHVDKFLNIDENFLYQTKPEEVVLIIDYFGFTYDQKIFERIKNKKCLCIQDASQSLLTKNIRKADFTIFSLTKCLGLPDGGMIETSDNKFQIETTNAPLPFVESAKLYRQKRAQFDEGANVDWYSFYLNHKKIEVPIGLFEMSNFSKALYESYDQFDIIKKTRNNYQFLQKYLQPIQKLKSGVTPLGFPILHEKREKLIEKLHSEKIYPPIHWSLKKVPKNFNDSYWVSERELTIPCDHRYNEKHMKKIIQCVKTL